MHITATWMKSATRHFWKKKHPPIFAYCKSNVWVLYKLSSFILETQQLLNYRIQSKLHTRNFCMERLIIHQCGKNLVSINFWPGPTSEICKCLLWVTTKMAVPAEDTRGHYKKSIWFGGIWVLFYADQAKVIKIWLKMFFWPIVSPGEMMEGTEDLEEHKEELIQYCIMIILVFDLCRLVRY